MFRTRFAVLAATAAAVAATAVFTAPEASAAPTAQDQAFMAASAQTNLAEITLGGIVKPKTTDQQTLDVADTTVRDHQTAQTKLIALAKQKAVTLPTAPNATQQAGAAQVQSADSGSVDLTYGQVQVQGHQVALAGIAKELSSGSDPDVKAFATAQRPIVAMHLQMAQALVASAGGAPVGVPAGTGGQAAAQGGSMNWIVPTTWGAAGLLAVVALAWATRRRTLSRR